MNPTTVNPEPTQAPTDPWNEMLANLRRRYPGASDGTLFCVLKLQQDPDLGLRDLRPEADLHGLRVAGRSLHSARVLLGLGKAAAGRVAKAPAPAPVPPAHAAGRRSPGSRPSNGDDSIESKVIQAVRQIQSAAQAETVRLRQAIAEAIAVLQDALGGRA